MTRACIDFVREHEHEDTARLLLSAARYPAIDMPMAVRQIEGRRTAREKWPGLSAFDEFLYPPRLNREQASSEITAWHKCRIVSILPGGAEGLAVADLTGGMGIDSIAFARSGMRVDYVERDPELCANMEHNRTILGLEGIDIHQGDSLQWLAGTHKLFDLIYIDPARRSVTGRKVSAFEECEPDILQHLSLLRSSCRWLMVKASPMIDIEMGCRQLGGVSDVHIVSVRGECKEVLFVCGDHPSETLIHCVVSDREPASYAEWTFTRSEEVMSDPLLCAAVGHYLYEPDAALMKGGPFNLIAHRLGLEQLARNTHLYTADTLLTPFLGRVFEVLTATPLTRKALKAALPEGCAHVLTRNYPVAAATLQQQLGLKEGGDLFVIATTVGKQRTGFLCRLVYRQ